MRNKAKRSNRRKYLLVIAAVLSVCMLYAAALDGVPVQPDIRPERQTKMSLATVAAQETHSLQTALRTEDTILPPLPDTAAHIVDPYVQYTHTQLLLDAAALAQMYPALISTSDIGQSVEGRELLLLRLGKGAREIVLTGTIHGNEYFATGFLMYMVDRYAYGYAMNERYNGYSYRALLDAVTFVIVPMLNPDGVNIAQNGPDAAQDPAAVRAMSMQGARYNEWKANANGVDLNRNFPLLWSNYNHITKPSARYYVGPAAASEPETQAVIGLLESTEYWMLADFHCYGEIIYWADNYNGTTDEYAAIAHRIMDEIEYGDAGMEDADSFAGYLQNYARATSGRFAMTVEVGSYLGYDEADFDSAAYPLYVIGLVMADVVARDC